MVSWDEIYIEELEYRLEDLQDKYEELCEDIKACRRYSVSIGEDGLNIGECDFGSYVEFEEVYKLTQR